MSRRFYHHAGVLCAALAAATLSCGERKPTEPGVPSALIAPGYSENFETSPLRESRELLIDGRPTDIEWNGTGDASYAIARGDGGTFFVLIRSLWTYDARTQEPRGLYLLFQWPDRGEDRLESPLRTNLDTGDADGITTIDCSVDNRIVQPGSWRRSDEHEDQVIVELYGDSLAGFPADAWRWGAETTDLAVPVNPAEYTTAVYDEWRGSAEHPLGGAVEEYFNTGSGWVLDAGKLSSIPNTQPNSDVPLFKHDKSTRDVRLNRGKQAAYVIWRAVARGLAPCDTLNPIRVDDASVRDKTWNPGDYLPSVVIQLPDSSQSDVVARGGWLDAKWTLEMRRELIARPPRVAGVVQPPRPDDVQFFEGRRYAIRIKIFNASKSQYSETELLPLYLKPRN